MYQLKIPASFAQHSDVNSFKDYSDQVIEEKTPNCSLKHFGVGFTLSTSLFDLEWGLQTIARKCAFERIDFLIFVSWPVCGMTGKSQQSEKATCGCSRGELSQDDKMNRLLFLYYKIPSLSFMLLSFCSQKHWNINMFLSWSLALLLIDQSALTELKQSNTSVH